MLVGGHPLKAVEASEVYGIGKSSERALAAQVEIDLEVAHGEFAQSSVNRFAITAPGVIRFRYRTPVAVLLVHGDHVIRVVLGFEVDHQGQMSIYPQCGGRKRCAFETM